MPEILTTLIKKIKSITRLHAADYFRKNKRNKWSTIYRSEHLQSSQNVAEKCSYGMDWRLNTVPVV